MKRLGFVVLALILLSTFTISGCSSAQKKISDDVKGIKTKVDTLETRVEGVETKQSETERLAMEQSERMESLRSERAARPSTGKTNVSMKSNVKMAHKGKAQLREVQTCLKNADFYKGEVDGVKGRKTTAAIKKFQSANGLGADGVVGKKTWEALSKYTSGGAVAASGGAEEASTK